MFIVTIEKVFETANAYIAINGCIFVSVISNIHLKIKAFAKPLLWNQRKKS